MPLGTAEGVGAMFKAWEKRVTGIMDTDDRIEKKRNWLIASIKILRIC